MRKCSLNIASCSLDLSKVFIEKPDNSSSILKKKKSEERICQEESLYTGTHLITYPNSSVSQQEIFFCLSEAEEYSEDLVEKSLCVCCSVAGLSEPFRGNGFITSGRILNSAVASEHSSTRTQTQLHWNHPFSRIRRLSASSLYLSPSPLVFNPSARGAWNGWILSNTYRSSQCTCW